MGANTYIGNAPNFMVKSIAEENKILYWGQIMNIYFSFTRLEEIFDSVNERNEVSLYKALKDICTDINESMGNINNIDPIVNEDNIIKFIDQTPIPGVKQIANELGLDNFKHEDREAILEIYGYNVNKSTSNFVRKVGLTTEISKNYATMITIGATANGSIPGVEATAFSRWNIGLKDRFKNNVVDANETSLKISKAKLKEITALEESLSEVNKDGVLVRKANAEQIQAIENEKAAIVKVRLTGACETCYMSAQTLKMGIEKHLVTKFPEIVGVIQVL